MEELTFKRPLKPSNVWGKRSLVIFSDGSTQAYGTCAYLRWQVEEDEFVTNQIVAKNKIAPVKQLSIPRLELCGALIAARLRKTIVREFNWEFESGFHIVDWSIVRSQIQRVFQGFKAFVAVRIAEIQDKTDPRDWSWVDSSQNVADLTSKPYSPEEIGKESIWQSGPRFLILPVSQWLIKQLCESQLPDRTGITMSVSKLNEPTGLSVINVDRFSNYRKLLKVMSRIRAIFRYTSLKGAQQEPTWDDMNEAELIWVKEMQKDLPDWKTRFKRLGPIFDNGEF